jgi:hypothetical protein
VNIDTLTQCNTLLTIFFYCQYHFTIGQSILTITERTRAYLFLSSHVSFIIHSSGSMIRCEPILIKILFPVLEIRRVRCWRVSLPYFRALHLVRNWLHKYQDFGAHMRANNSRKITLSLESKCSSSSERLCKELELSNGLNLTHVCYSAAPRRLCKQTKSTYG